MENIRYTVILYVDREELLPQMLASVQNESNPAAAETEILIAAEEQTAEMKEICRAADGRNGTAVRLLSQAVSMADAYNEGLAAAKGTFVNFNLASNHFQRGAFASVEQAASDTANAKMICLSPWTVNEVRDLKRYTMSPTGDWHITHNIEITEDSVIESDAFYAAETIDINPDPARLCLMLAAYFIRKDIIRAENRFRGAFHEDALVEFLIRLQDKNRKYVYLPGSYLYYTVPMEDNVGAYTVQHQKYWYTEAVQKWMIPLAEDAARTRWPIPGYMRVALYYLLYARYNCNVNDRNKGILNHEEYEQFRKASGQLLRYIGVSQIIHPHDNSSFSISAPLRMFFIRLRNEAGNDPGEFMLDGKSISFWERGNENSKRAELFLAWKHRKNLRSEAAKGKNLHYSVNLFTVKRQKGQMPEMERVIGGNSVVSLCNLTNQNADINVVNYRNGCLEIDGQLSVGNFADHDNIRVIVRKVIEEVQGTEEYEAVQSECYALNKAFGESFSKRYRFHASVPVPEGEPDSIIQFWVEINGHRFKQNVRAASVYAHFHQNFTSLHWNFDGNRYLRYRNATSLKVVTLSEEEVMEAEAKIQDVLARRSENGDLIAEKTLAIRRGYYETMEYYEGRRVWLTFDKLYKAGDNGEYVYHYVHEHAPEIDMYYIANNESADYARLKEAGEKVLGWAEVDTLVAALHAEAVLATHENLFRYIGFDPQMTQLVCDLFDPFNVCIQHGLTTQAIAQHQNRWIDNLKLYTCASPNEVANISHPIYGFEDKSVLQLTGLGRYDGLRNKDKKQILITPTWRKDLANAGKMGSSRSYNEFFKDSEYYRLYNGLISDPELVKTANETGYRIIYLLHPVISVQLPDFEQREGVEIIAAAGDMSYEQILTESSLMVTDYSGVQFDFAYQRKPVLYYHPKTLPAHYEESPAYVYKTMAFGPLIDNHEELVRQLCEYMRGGCQMKPEYKERADRFFAYDDFNSCERIYKAIREQLG